MHYKDLIYDSFKNIKYKKRFIIQYNVYLFLVVASKDDCVDMNLFIALCCVFAGLLIIQFVVMVVCIKKRQGRSNDSVIPMK